MRLVHAGVDRVTVKTPLGHTKITTTARYAHCLFDDKMSAVMRLEKQLPVGFSGEPDAKRSPAPVNDATLAVSKLHDCKKIGP